MENELQWIYKMYVEVDGEGEIIDSLGGTNIVPLKEYTFFFIDTAIVEGEVMPLPLVMENMFKLKIVMNSFKPVFVLKDPNETLSTEMPGVAVMEDEKTEAAPEETV